MRQCDIIAFHSSSHHPCPILWQETVFLFQAKKLFDNNAGHWLSFPAFLLLLPSSGINLRFDSVPCRGGDEGVA